MYSLSLIPKSSISAPAKFTFDGITWRFSISVFTIHSLIVHSSSINSYMVFSISSFSIPKPLVVFPCGSVSIVNTFLLFSAKHADKFIAVVVFPTPPF